MAGWYIIQSGSFEVCVDDRAVRQLRSKHSFGELAMLYSVLPGIGVQGENSKLEGLGRFMINSHFFQAT